MRDLQRRTLLLLPLAAPLSACSLAQTDVVLDVEPTSVGLFLDALGVFTRTNKYELTETGPGVLDFGYKGKHATIFVRQYEPGIIHVQFEAMPPALWEWFFSFDPSIDTIAEDFKRVMLQVEGVRLHES